MFRDIIREAFHFNFTHDEFEHAALDFYSLRLSCYADGNANPELLITGNSNHVHMHQASVDRLPLPLAQHDPCGSFARNLQCKDRVVPAAERKIRRIALGSTATESVGPQPP